jgi:hypothetical protein
MYKYIRYLFISLAVFLLIVSCTNSQETFSQSQQPESGSTSSLMTQSPTGPMKLYKIGQPWQNEHFYCQ